MHIIKNYLFFLLLSFTLISCGGGGGGSVNEEDITLSSISLNTLSQVIKLNETFQLIVTGTYTDNSTQVITDQVSWVLSDTSVMTISNLGLITALSTGSVTITATLNNVSESTTATVIVLDEIIILPTSLNIALDSTQQLTATGRYSDNITEEELTNQVNWNSDTPLVASISDSGLLTALALGTSQVSATINGISNTVSVTVFEPSLSQIEITAPSQSLKLNETFQLIATGTYSDASNQVITNQVNWVSSNSGIVTVSSTGLMTVISSGAVSISATLDGVSENESVTAIALVGLNISPATLTLAWNTTQQLSVSGEYTDNSTEDLTSSVSWYSDTSLVASISSSGLLAALSSGSSQVSATLNGVTDIVTVSILPPPLTQIAITVPEQNLKLNETFQLIATGTYADASTQSLTNQVNWVSSDNAVFSVSNTGLITAISAGTSTISATLDSVSENLAVTAISLDELSISPSTATLALGSTRQLSVIGRYSDNSIENLTSVVSWDSDTVAVATVSSSGLLTTLTSGSTQITVTFDGISSIVSLVVPAATLQTVEISAPESIAAGVLEQLTAVGTYSDGSIQIITTDLSWQSSDVSIATIDAGTAQLNSILQGTVTITATIGLISDNVNVDITPATLSSLSITPSNVSLAKGSKKTVKVIAIYSDQSHLDVSNQINWVSSDDGISDVEDGSSKVEGINVGNNILTASFSSLSANLTVNITDAELNSLSILPINTSLPKGMTQEFSVNGVYTDGTVQDLTHQVTWISSDNDITTIDNSVELKGIASAVETGGATITASLDGVEISTSFTINNAQLSSIEISPSSIEVAKGVEILTTAIGHYTDGGNIDITQQVIWESSNNSIANLSTQSPGKIDATSEGEAIVSASLNGISALALISVNAATLQSINIETNNLSLPNGTEYQLAATGVYSDSSNVDITKQVTWQSSDNSILTVDNVDDAQSQNVIGLVRSLSLGTSTVNASLNGVSKDIILTVSNAVLEQIMISAVSTDLNVKATTQATAIASFSDDNTLDVTHQVNWFSSDAEIASVAQLTPNAGLLTGIADGDVQLTASLSGISSNNLSISISLDPNLPSSMAMSLTPNVILNNATDSSLVEVTLTPSSESGVISNGTSIDFEITEGNNTRIETATTNNGVASLNLTSTYEGLITVQASLSDGLNTQGGILSTNSFVNIIVSTALSNAVYSNGTLLKDSILLIYLRNISNRTLNIPAIYVAYGPVNAQINFPDSPVSDDLYTSDGDLKGGEFTSFGYILDNDIADDTFWIIYNFTESITGVSFPYGGIFSF